MSVLNCVKHSVGAALVSVAVLGSLAPTVSAAETAAAASAAKYSTAATKIGDLLADPAAKAVLDARLPEISKSQNLDMIRGLTLKELQGMAPDRITDKVLAEIDAALAALG